MNNEEIQIQFPRPGQWGEFALTAIYRDAEGYAHTDRYTQDDIPADQARFKLEKLAPGARYIRMRNATDKQMQIYLYEFAVTTKEDTSIDPVRLMYDKNLESVNTLTASSRITIDKEKEGSLELYLSGSPCSQVVVEGSPLKGKVKQVLYSGPANYIKLKKEALESVKALELYNAGSSPVNIHEIN